MPVKTKNKNVRRTNADPATIEKNVKHDKKNSYVVLPFSSPCYNEKHRRNKETQFIKFSFIHRIFIL